MKTQAATRAALDEVEAHYRRLRAELPPNGLGEADALAHAMTSLRGIRWVGFKGPGYRLTMEIHTEDPEPRRGQVRKLVRAALKRRGVDGWSRLKFRFIHVEDEVDRLLRGER